ncbi:MAG: hypothetical protein HYR88_05835, partial [Verrucomicrobia bacterium]|nr:hypothetical protein [Verrucomicrobiota bacterium]
MTNTRLDEGSGPDWEQMRKKRPSRRASLELTTWLCMALCVGAALAAIAEDEFELPPLNYSRVEPDDEVHRLLRGIDENPALLRSGSD